MITIITPVFNNIGTIKYCVESIRAQRDVVIEHIIIDGGSSDGTLNYLKDNNCNFISEKDNGIYDAMNKGIKNSTGKIIGILNSDDMYNGSCVLKTIYKTFENNDVDIVYGNIVCVDKQYTEKVIRNYRSCSYSEKMFKKGGHPPHPGFFVRRKIYEKYGMFSLKYKIAADYEFMLRTLYKNKVKSIYIDEYLVKMRVGGASNSSIKAIYESNRECKNAWIDNDIKPPIGLVFRKPFSKIKQIINKQDGDI